MTRVRRRTRRANGDENTCITTNALEVIYISNHNNKNLSIAVNS